MLQELEAWSQTPSETRLSCLPCHFMDKPLRRVLRIRDEHRLHFETFRDISRSLIYGNRSPFAALGRVVFETAR